MNNIFRALVISFALIIIILLVSINNSEKTTSTSVQQPLTTTVGDRMPSNFRDPYIKSCNTDGKSGAYCECTMVWLENHFTNQEILDLSVEYVKTNKLPDAMWGAVKDCMYLSK